MLNLQPLTATDYRTWRRFTRAAGHWWHFTAAGSRAAFSAVLQPPAHSYLLMSGKHPAGLLTLTVSETTNTATIAQLALRRQAQSALPQVIQAAVAMAHQWYVGVLTAPFDAAQESAYTAAGFTVRANQFELTLR